MSLSTQELPENVRHLKPVPVVLDTPTNEDIMSMLIQLQNRISEIQQDIKDTKESVSRIVDEVKPTLEMLTHGPIGQILGIAPKPEPRNRRR